LFAPLGFPADDFRWSQPMFDRLSLPESKDLDDDFERMCVEKKAVIFDYVKRNVGNAKL
jgi:hypothetical protein